MKRSVICLLVGGSAIMSVLGFAALAQEPAGELAATRPNAGDQTEVLQALLAEMRELKQQTLDLQQQVEVLDRRADKEVIRAHWIAHVLSSIEDLVPASYKTYIRHNFKVMSHEYSRMNVDDRKQIEDEFGRITSGS